MLLGSPAGRPGRYFICDAKLAALGWRERTPWEQGLRQTVAWYLEHVDGKGAEDAYWDKGAWACKFSCKGGDDLALTWRPARAAVQRAWRRRWSHTPTLPWPASTFEAFSVRKPSERRP